MSTEDLNLMKEIDPCIEEIALTVNCSACNEDKSYHIRDGLLCIVKRTVEPRIQILLKPAWPMDDNRFCRIHWVESSGRFEEQEPGFLFPCEKRGLVVYFENHASYIRARSCIKSLILSNEHKLRLETYQTYQSAALAHRFNVKKFWKLKRFLKPNRFLKPWLKRELECLMIVEDEFEVVLHHVLGTIEDFCKKFNPRKAVNPEETESMFKGVIAQATEKFIMNKAERFAEELVIFLASEMTLEAYDDVCRRNPSNWSENLTSWVEDKIDSLLLKQGGHRGHQADSCIRIARSAKSISELQSQLVNKLKFPSSANTRVFSKILFDRISVQRVDNHEGRPLKRSRSEGNSNGSGSGSSNRRF